MKKLFITLTMALMLFVGTTSSASAVSLADLQQQIKDLTEQVAALSQALGAQSFSIPLTGALQTTSATVTPIVNTNLLQSATTTTTPTAVKTIAPATTPLQLNHGSWCNSSGTYLYDMEWGCVPAGQFKKRTTAFTGTPSPLTSVNSEITNPAGQLFHGSYCNSNRTYRYDWQWGCVPSGTWKPLPAAVTQTTTNDNTNSPFTTGTVLRPGTKGSADVMKMQQLLKDKGFYFSTIDGSYGPGTIAAVRAFQAAQGYKADGIAGPMTLSGLLTGMTALPLPPANPNLTRACRSTDDPWIQVLSPNGGEVYQAGQQVTVRWKSCNVPANTNLILFLTADEDYRGNSLSRGDVYTQTGNGSATYIIPSSGSGWDRGKYYRMIASVDDTIRNSIGNPIQDSSDNLFTINQSQIACSSGDPVITLIDSPITGGTLNKGGKMTVSWKWCNIHPESEVLISLKDVSSNQRYLLSTYNYSNVFPGSSTGNYNSNTLGGSDLVTIPAHIPSGQYEVLVGGKVYPNWNPDFVQTSGVFTVR